LYNHFFTYIYIYNIYIYLTSFGHAEYNQHGGNDQSYEDNVNAHYYFLPRKVNLPMTTKRIMKTTKSIMKCNYKNIHDGDDDRDNDDDDANNVEDEYITVNVPVHMISVTCGTNFTIGIDNHGDLYSWGWNESGCLGQGKTCFSDNDG